MRRRTIITPALAAFAGAVLGIGLLTPSTVRAEEDKTRGASSSASPQRGAATPRGAARTGAPANFRLILDPVITTRDLPVMLRSVEADPGQRLVLESILSDYEAAFEAGVAPLRDALGQLRPQTPSAEERQRLREEARRQMDQLRQEIEAARERARAGDNAARDVIQERMREFRNEVGGNVRPQTPTGAELEAILAVAAPLAATWSEQREQLTSDVFANLEAMFVGDARDQWRAAVAEWRRRSLVRNSELEGENADLAATISRMEFGEENTVALQSVLQAYAEAMDEALAVRNATLRNTTADLEFAILRGDQSTAESLLTERMTQHVAVRNVNDEYIEKMSDAVDGIAGDRLEAQLMEKAYPRAYRPTATHRLFASAKQISSLEPSVREAIISLEQAFLAAMDEANRAIVIGIRDLEPDRTGDIAARRIAQVTGVPAPRTPDPTLPLFRERQTVERAFADQLKALLTPEQIAKASGKGGRGVDRGRARNGRSVGRDAIPRNDPRNFSNQGGGTGGGTRGGGRGGGR